MSKSLRLSEKWFRRGLWAVAVVLLLCSRSSTTRPIQQSPSYSRPTTESTILLSSML